MPAPLNLFALPDVLVGSLAPFSFFDADEDEVSDRSDSESEDEVDIEDLEIEPFAHLKGSPYVYYTSPHIEKDHVLAVYKRWFDIEVLQREPVNALKKLETSTKSAVIMIGGGHFSAAIIQHKPKSLIRDKNNPFANIVISHSKSFHRYTTRRKQGGAQSASDNAHGKANSAGSSMRRQNEMMLKQEVQALLNSWAHELKGCHSIFYHASGRTNKGIIIGYDPKCPISASDPRLRAIPLTTRRPTADEVKRVWKELTTVRILPAPEYKAPEVAKPVPSAKKPSPQPAPIKEVVEETRDEKITQAIKKSSLSDLKSLLGDKLDEYMPGPRATPLVYAARTGKHQIVGGLLRWGADPTVKVGGKTLGEHAAPHAKVVDTLQIVRKELGEKWAWDSANVGPAMTREDITRRDEAARQEKAKEQMAAFQERENKEKEERIEKLINKHGSGRTTGGQAAQTAGLTEEEKRHIERERRARAAEARMRRT